MASAEAQTQGDTTSFLSAALHLLQSIQSLYKGF